MRADMRYLVSNLLYKMDQRKDYSRRIGLYEVSSDDKEKTDDYNIIIFKEGEKNGYRKQ